ncbi:SufE family protein [Blattabacterium cuenoti]|uniref:SufE family protein n=1 Tax=Blattabacterium cuenoti TaxID=1653831 RepID=UPI001EEA652B|nr:SufE family protein [Blattabacterium cuenoti]
MISLRKKEETIKKEFNQLNSWEEKYEYLIDLGGNLSKKSDEFRSDKRLIHGCQSRIWLDAEIKESRIFFDADGDALLPRGMAALMIYVYSGVFPFEIIYSNANFIYEIGFQTFLSPIRANGMFLFLKKIKFYAMAFNTKISIELNNKKRK